MRMQPRMTRLALTGLALGAAVTTQTVPASAAPTASTLYFAVVNDDGTRARSTDGVRSQQLGTGRYSVRFPVNVSRCAFSATVGTSDTTVGPGGTAVVSSQERTRGRGVIVKTVAQGALADRGFHLIVVCQ